MACSKLILAAVACALVFHLTEALPLPELKSSPVPIVMWHGMGDNCCLPMSMGAIKKKLESSIPGVHVHSLMIGESPTKDSWNSFFMDANTQVEEACKLVQADEALANGYYAIGFSQGGQFLRALLERCDGPPMKRLITLGGQHRGVYGMPHCMGANHTLCEIARKTLDLGADTAFVQHHLAQADYWNDALHQDKYLKDNIFLPDINNEGASKNQQYIDRINSLEHLVLLKFEQDSMVQPRESSHFEFYAPGQDKTILPLRESPLYQEDWIGLKSLDQRGALTMLSCEGDHLQLPKGYFEENIIPLLQ